MLGIFTKAKRDHHGAYGKISMADTDEDQGETMAGPESQAQPDPQEEVVPFQKGLAREVLEVIFFAVSILIFINGYVWQNFQIPTESMENTLLIGDHLTVNTFVFQGQKCKWLPYRQIRRGDVVVFKYPQNDREDFIKRCVGLPGDVFDIRENATYINGKALKEDYAFYKMLGLNERDPENKFRPVGFNKSQPGLKHAQYNSGRNIPLKRLIRQTESSLQHFKLIHPGAYAKVYQRLTSGPANTIPPGFYLMLGDNRNNSGDSREWGLVPQELIRGRAWFVWWSYGEDLGSHNRTLKQKVINTLSLPLNFFTRTRWKETFQLIK